MGPTLSWNHAFTRCMPASFVRGPAKRSAQCTMSWLVCCWLACLLTACQSSLPPKPSVPSSPVGSKEINIIPQAETNGPATAGIDPNIPLETAVTPKLEPIVKGTTRPYLVNGEWMRPMSDVRTPYVETGVASWYGKKFHGRNTASGEPYNLYKLSAAHRLLPIPSYARVTNLKSGKSLIVRVNDRGPFGRDRIIDLSYAAAKQLDIIQQGSGKVEVRLIDTTQLTSTDPASSKLDSTAQASPAAPQQAVLSTEASNNPNAITTPSGASDAAATATTPAAQALTHSALAAGVYVQAGAFSQLHYAERLSQRIASRLPATQSQLNKVYNGRLFQVLLGPYPDQVAAAQVAAQLRDQLQISALIFSR